MSEEFSAIYEVGKGESVFLSIRKLDENISLVSEAVLANKVFPDDPKNVPLLIGKWDDFITPKELKVYSIGRYLGEKEGVIQFCYVLKDGQEKEFLMEIRAKSGERKEIIAAFTLKQKIC
jgi:hypothetical protein